MASFSQVIYRLSSRKRLALSCQVKKNRGRCIARNGHRRHSVVISEKVGSASEFLIHKENGMLFGVANMREVLKQFLNCQHVIISKWAKSVVV